MFQTDVLIIGSGIAGATAALRLARNPQRQVVVITRDPDPHESNSRYAQGGVVGRGLDDDADLLVKDILAAGAGASSPQAARILSEEGPALLQEILVESAHIQFDSQPDGEPEYGKEAAHSRRRILHVGDGTGQAIMAGLVGGLVIGVVVDRTIQVVVRRRLSAAKPAGAGAVASEVAKPAGPGVASELAKSHPLHAVVRSLGENQRGA